MKFINPVIITDGMFVSSSIAETDHPAWNPATNYALEARCIRTTTHCVYQRIVAGISATAPELDSVNWIKVGPTNRWAMFDRATGTVSTATTSLSVTFAPGLVRGLTLLDMTASSATVTMMAGGETVYTRTVNLLSGDGVTDWYSFFFSPVVFKRTLVLQDLPPYADGEITVTLNGVGAVSIGTVVVGPVVTIGQPLIGTSLGILDYSVKTRDQFNTVTVTERAYADRMSQQVMVRANDVDEVARQLKLIRAKPVVWVASTTYSQSVIYGFYKDWSIDVRYPEYSFCSLTIEGLS